MKRKVIILILAFVLLILALCSRTTYTVKIVDDYPLENELKRGYPAGATVTVVLPTITEHAYHVFINGDRCAQDKKSNLEYSFFTFTMPDQDVVIEIEDHWVSIPERP